MLPDTSRQTFSKKQQTLGSYLHHGFDGVDCLAHAQFQVLKREDGEQHAEGDTDENGNVAPLPSERSIHFSVCIQFRILGTFELFAIACNAGSEGLKMSSIFFRDNSTFTFCYGYGFENELKT